MLNSENFDTKNVQNISNIQDFKVTQKKLFTNSRNLFYLLREGENILLS